MWGIVCFGALLGVVYFVVCDVVMCFFGLGDLCSVFCGLWFGIWPFRSVFCAL